MAHGGGGGEESEGSSERWLVSYSDFITLLMVLFVVLYSMGQVDVQKYKELAASMRDVFSLGGAPASIVDTQINQTSGAIEDGQPKPIAVPGIPESPPQSEEVASQLTQMLSSQNLGNEVSVQTNIDGVLISLSEKLLFPSGSSDLPADAKPVLDTIANMLKPIDNKIRLIGNTDNSQPTNSRYANNWDLSLARAMAVANYLINAGIDPSRLIVSGQGQYNPVFANDTAEHRALNSRVDIVIIYQVDSSVLGTDSIGVTP